MCHTDDPSQNIKTPACILRPVLTPRIDPIIDAVGGQGASAPVDAARETMVAALRSFHLPTRITFDPGTTGVDSITITHFFDQVTDVTAGFDHVQGTMFIRLNMDVGILSGFINLSGNVVPQDFATTTDSPWTITFVFGLYTGQTSRPGTQGTNSSQAYSGLGFTLINILVDGEIHTPNPIPKDVDMAPMGGALLQALGTQLDSLASLELVPLGNLRAGTNGLLTQPNVLRCMFAGPGRELALPTQCPDQSLQPIYNASIGTSITVNYAACSSQ